MMPLGVRSCVLWLVALLAIGAMASAVRANETDQFTMPDHDTFADLGPYMTRLHHDVLDRVVRTSNQRIMKVLRDEKNPAKRDRKLGEARSPGKLADQVREIFGPAMFEIEEMEKRFYSKDFRAQFPDQLAAYKPKNWIYADALLLIDPRRLLFLQNPSSTIKVYGVYFGTDKVGHFHDLGHLYYKDFLRLRREGKSDEEALNWVRREYSTHGLVSENGLVGNAVAGVYSNADLAANYVGMRFYQNLTEPVRIKGEEHPPLIIRNGDFLRLNDHVKRESDWFSVFVSDHYNEALNPNVHDWMMRDSVRQRVRKRSARIIHFYSEPLAPPRTSDYFRDLAQQLSTYYGEPYGHSGMKDKMIGIYNTCFDDE